MSCRSTDKVVIASAGMQADRKALHKLLQVCTRGTRAWMQLCDVWM